jgi:hypothetical protein
MVRGMSWCPEEFREVGSAGLTCKCLCRKHNNDLSPCDEEIKKLQRALEDWQRPYTRGARYFYHDLSGLLIGRWLAKTLCTQTAAAHRQVQPTLANFAFTEQDDPGVWIYSTFVAGQPFDLNTAYVGMRWVHHPDGDNVAVYVPVFNFPFIVSTFPLEPHWPDLADLLQVPRAMRGRLMNRIRRMDLRSKQGTLLGNIGFRW